MSFFESKAYAFTQLLSSLFWDGRNPEGKKCRLHIGESKSSHIMVENCPTNFVTSYVGQMPIPPGGDGNEEQLPLYTESAIFFSDGSIEVNLGKAGQDFLSQQKLEFTNRMNALGFPYSYEQIDNYIFDGTDEFINPKDWFITFGAKRILKILEWVKNCEKKGIALEILFAWPQCSTKNIHAASILKSISPFPKLPPVLTKRQIYIVHWALYWLGKEH